MISNSFKSTYSGFASGFSQWTGNLARGTNAPVTAIASIFSLFAGAGAAKKGVSSIATTAGEAAVEKALNDKTNAITAQNSFSREEVQNTIESTLGKNPINNYAKNQLGTVFDKLLEAKQAGIINKKGNISTSMGEIDPNSELGKKIIMGGDNDND